MELSQAQLARIYQWAYRLLQDHHDALDAVQEVALRAQAARSVAIQNCDGWLRRVATNHCLDRLRRRRRAPRALSVLPIDHEEPADALTRRELADRLGAALAQLTPRQRAVVTAKVFDGQSFARIAVELAISTSSAKTHYLRGLSALRAKLTAQQGKPSWIARTSLT